MNPKMNQEIINNSDCEIGPQSKRARLNNTSIPEANNTPDLVPIYGTFGVIAGFARRTDDNNIIELPRFTPGLPYTQKLDNKLIARLDTKQEEAAEAIINYKDFSTERRLLLAEAGQSLGFTNSAMKAPSNHRI